MDLGQILLGGAITLAGTAAVQRYLMPRVHARTRGQERWENDMLALAALVEEELPRAIDGYRWGGYSVRIHRLAQHDPKYDAAKVEVALAEAIAETRHANAALGEQMGRLKTLITRAKRLNADARYWRQLELHHMRLQASMWDVPGHEPGAPGLDDDQWEKVWDGAEEARKGLLRRSMRSPSGYR